MPDGTVKLGDLLVKLNLISQTDLDKALHLAPQFGLPVGRTLVLSGCLSEQELQVAVELQPQVNKKGLAIATATKIASDVRSGQSPAQALRGLISKETLEKTALGELLLESGAITQQQLEEAQRGSYQTGMRFGRMLVLNGIINPTQLTQALNVQSMLREMRIPRPQAIEMLSEACVKNKPASDAIQKAMAPQTKQVRFTEFLVSSGLATETEMLNAMEQSINRALSLGETIVEQGLISDHVFKKAVELHNKVSSGEMAINDAIEQLNRMVFGAPAHDKQHHTPVLGELLKLSGLVTDNDIQEAINLANKYPSVIGKMLVLSGAIDEATLIASLRCQFLLKNGYLKLDDAVVALKYSKDHKMSFDDALEELGLRKDGNVPQE